jgi:ABC-2 type transport system ATP-binding protein
VQDGLDLIAGDVTLFPQEPEIFENTIEYNITLGLPFEPAELDAICRTVHFTEVLEQLPKGLQSSIMEKGVNLSGGQKQRFSIATTLVNEPVMIFLDEPTTGLDPQARRNLWDLITQIKSKGTTIILTTHYMDEAQQLCDQIAIMDEGKIVALDSPKNLIQQLLSRGFTPHTEVPPATLEDVFIDLTGKELRD